MQYIPCYIVLYCVLCHRPVVVFRPLPRSLADRARRPLACSLVVALACSYVRSSVSTLTAKARRIRACHIWFRVPLAQGINRQRSFVVSQFAAVIRLLTTSFTLFQPATILTQPAASVGNCVPILGLKHIRPSISAAPEAAFFAFVRF